MLFWGKFWSKKNPENTNVARPLMDSLDDYIGYKRPQGKQLLNDTPLIAVDFETTGLDSNRDEIIAMGFCPIGEGCIRLANCSYFVVQPRQLLTSENVVIHGLTDDQVSKGISMEQAMLKFLELTKGKIIIAHYHNIEKHFIQRAAEQIFGRTIPLSILDTFDIAERRMRRRNQPIRANSLRLFNLRKQFGLPNYNAHNALEDAISTAELFLAQVASLNMAKEELRLNRLGLINSE